MLAGNFSSGAKGFRPGFLGRDAGVSWFILSLSLSLDVGCKGSGVNFVWIFS